MGNRTMVNIEDYPNKKVWFFRNEDELVTKDWLEHINCTKKDNDQKILSIYLGADTEKFFDSDDIDYVFKHGSKMILEEEGGFFDINQEYLLKKDGSVLYRPVHWSSGDEQQFLQ
jgi:hypothetical protein